ncbi:MAG: hypothetical protein AAF802_18780 [Planctomycetota bacterium]
MSAGLSGQPASFGAPVLYRASGKVSPASLVIAAVLLIPLGILLGAVYSAGVVYLPFVKLRGLVTFGTALLLGGIAGKLCHKLKYRSKFLAVLTILGFISIAYYTSWAVHPVFVVGLGEFGDDPLFIMLNMLDPRFILGWMKMIYENGLWGMGGGNALSGIAVVAIWLIEAGLLYGFGFVTGVAAYGNRPFCESCDCWNDETQDLAVLPVAMSDPSWAQIRNGNFDALRKLQIVEDRNNSYVELRLADCSSCDDSDYLSAIGITLTVDNGEIKKNESYIFQHLSVTRAQRDEIIAFAEAMAEAVEEMNQALEDDTEDFEDSDGQVGDEDGSIGNEEDGNPYRPS